VEKKMAKESGNVVVSGGKLAGGKLIGGKGKRKTK